MNFSSFSLSVCVRVVCQAVLAGGKERKLYVLSRGDAGLRESDPGPGGF